MTKKTLGYVELEGADLNPRWPEPDLGPGQREAERQELYKVFFDVDGKEYTYTTQDVERFTPYEVGSRWALTVNVAGSIREIEPTD